MSDAVVSSHYEIFVQRNDESYTRWTGTVYKNKVVAYTQKFYTRAFAIRKLKRRVRKDQDSETVLIIRDGVPWAVE